MLRPELPAEVEVESARMFCARQKSAMLLSIVVFT